MMYIVLLTVFLCYAFVETLHYLIFRRFLAQVITKALCHSSVASEADNTVLAPIATSAQPPKDERYQLPGQVSVDVALTKESTLLPTREVSRFKDIPRVAKIHAEVQQSRPAERETPALPTSEEIFQELRLELHGLCDVDFSGKYLLDLDKSDDSEEFLKLLGQNWFIRQAAKKCVVEITISQTMHRSHARIDVCSCISIIGKRIQWHQVVDGEERVYEEQDGTKVLCASAWDAERNGGTWIMKKRNLPGSSGKSFTATEERWLQPDNTLVLWREYSRGTDTVRFTSYFRPCVT